MSYEQAERIFKRPKIAQTAFRSIKVHLLHQLCDAHGITVKHTGAKGKARKDDYVNALINYKQNAINNYRLSDCLIIGRSHKQLRVCIYKNRRDWDHIGEQWITLERNGDLNLRSISPPAGLSGDPRVIDPKNRAPLYEYKPGFILAEDIPRMMQNECLRVEFIEKRQGQV